MLMRRLDSGQPDFAKALDDLTAWEDEMDQTVNDTVGRVIADIAARGDDALLDYTRQFDHLDVASVADLEIDPQRLQHALESIPAEQRVALEEAAKRIRDYHQHQLQDSWQYRD
ncbi:MAG: histidinol dehydrogenase, partial [Halioglobus sp.]